METILLENDTHLIKYEKIYNEYWLELMERATGNAYILKCKTKAHATAFFKGCTIQDAIRIMVNEFKIQPQQHYKASAYALKR
jgi:hypothetical protein